MDESSDKSTTRVLELTNDEKKVTVKESSVYCDNQFKSTQNIFDTLYDSCSVKPSAQCDSLETFTISSACEFFDAEFSELNLISVTNEHNILSNNSGENSLAACVPHTSVHTEVQKISDPCCELLTGFSDLVSVSSPARSCENDIVNDINKCSLDISTQCVSSVKSQVLCSELENVTNKCEASPDLVLASAVTKCNHSSVSALMPTVLSLPSVVLSDDSDNCSSSISLNEILDSPDLNLVTAESNTRTVSILLLMNLFIIIIGVLITHFCSLESVKCYEGSCDYFLIKILNVFIILKLSFMRKYP